MKPRNPTTWIFGDALSLLEQAERLHRQFFQAAAADARAWEPPVDIFEDESAVVVQVALPGVPPEAIGVQIHDDALTVTGARGFPARRGARIHRVEIPFGRFERRIALSLQGLGAPQHRLADGCLSIVFRKLRDAS
jgi:HSP20 family molecular chaperone IbpA